MQINFKSYNDCDFFIFGKHTGPIETVLPHKIPIRDLMLLVQGSLDQLKTVVLLSNIEFLKEISHSELKSSHYKIEKNKFIFLNYSIRNSLAKFDSSLGEVKSFNEIESYFERNLPAKNH